MLYGGGAPSSRLVVRSAVRREPIATCSFGVAPKRLWNGYLRFRKVWRAAWAGGRADGVCPCR